MHAGLLILVVEDNPQIQILVEETLSDRGFACEIAACGEEAKTLLFSGFDKYRAIITDIKLGGAVDGWEAARCARELSDAIPVIYMTGDSAHEWSSCGVPHSIVLHKPFAPAQLLKTLARILNSGTV